MDQEQNLEKKRLIIFVFLIIGAIVIVVGFIFGYLFGDRGCMENPFVYGAKQMNKINNDNYECSCKSEKTGDYFYFNSQKISEENLTASFP